jgi:hypothetical protein
VFHVERSLWVVVFSRYVVIAAKARRARRTGVCGLKVKGTSPPWADLGGAAAVDSLIVESMGESCLGVAWSVVMFGGPVEDFDVLDPLFRSRMPGRWSPLGPCALLLERARGLCRSQRRRRLSGRRLTRPGLGGGEVGHPWASRLGAGRFHLGVRGQ